MASKFGTREKCDKCQKSVYQDDRMTLDGKILHASCFRCAQCNTKLSTGNYAALEGSYFCKPHFKEQFKLKGRYDFGHKEGEQAPATSAPAPTTAPATTAPTTAPVTKPTPAPVTATPVAPKTVAPEPKKVSEVKPVVATPAPVKPAPTPAATSATPKPAETKPAPSPSGTPAPAPVATPAPAPKPAPVAEAPKVTQAEVAAVKAEISAIDWAKVDLAKLEALVNKVETLAGGPVASSAPLPPASSGAPAPPPPPPAVAIPAPAPAASTGNAGGMDAVFEALKSGNITSGLKHVTKEMKSKNNPNKTSVVSEVGSKKATTVKKATEEKLGTPRVELVEKKWVIEYQVGNKEIVLDNVELKHTVYIYGCKDSLIQIKGKVNSIAIDKCTKTSIVHEAIVAAVEVVNSKSIQIQCNDAVPTVSIDKTDGAHIFLTEKSLGAQIVTSKSSEMNISVPNAEDDYDELPVPEQFISTYDKPSKKLQTVHVSHI